MLAVQVAPGGPSEAAGVRPGDVILSLDGQPTVSVDAIHKLLDRETIGKSVPLVVLRDGVLQTLSLKVTPRPVRQRR